MAAHRWQIEETMAIVRQEMTLLGQVLPRPGLLLMPHNAPRVFLHVLHIHCQLEPLLAMPAACGGS